MKQSINTLALYHKAKQAFDATDGLPHAMRVETLRAENAAWRAHFIPALREADAKKAKMRLKAANIVSNALKNLTSEERTTVVRSFSDLQFIGQRN